MRYIPHTEEDITRMLRVIGAPSVDALFSHIPRAARLARPLAIEPLDELALMRHLGELGIMNTPSVGSSAREGGALAFLGAGLVSHHIPSAVDALLTRAEWYTSYTPYQPEISQGTLQAIFEFQTLVSELFGPPAPKGGAPMLLANASMYDGASALAEAVLMAQRITQRRNVVLCGALHPHYVETVRCYLAGIEEEAGEASMVRSAGFLETGRAALPEVEAAIEGAGAGLACLLVQTPNYLGVVEDIAPLAERAHARGALLIVICTEPLAMGVLRPPGALGADIVCGEGIGLAIPPSLGGPGVGLFAARAEHVRQMPGRLVGETVDRAGRRGYVLTLSTREQHIRREKATSNICTNQGLIALAFTIHMCLLGRQGFSALARLNLARAQYARERILGIDGISAAVSGPTFNEFAVRIKRGLRAEDLVARLLPQGIIAGVPLSRPGYMLPGLAEPERTLLIAVSERHSKDEIDELVLALDREVRR